MLFTSSLFAASVLVVANAIPVPQQVAPLGSSSATSSAAVPSSSVAGGNGGAIDYTSQTPYSGDITYFLPTEMGKTVACGNQNVDEDYIIAVSHAFFDSFPGATANPNENPVCHKNVTISNGDYHVNATITDRCGDCEQPYNIDLTPAAFKWVAKKADGRIPNVQWKFVDGPVTFPSPTDVPPFADGWDTPASGTPSSTPVGNSPTIIGSSVDARGLVARTWDVAQLTPVPVKKPIGGRQFKE